MSLSHFLMSSLYIIGFHMVLFLSGLTFISESSMKHRDACVGICDGICDGTCCAGAKILAATLSYTSMSGLNSWVFVESKLCELL